MCAFPLFSVFKQKDTRALALVKNAPTQNNRKTVSYIQATEMQIYHKIVSNERAAKAEGRKSTKFYKQNEKS